MTVDFRITGLKFAGDKQADGPARVLAHFDVEIGDVTLIGCMLVKRDAGQIFTPKDQKRFSIRDEALRQAITKAALEIYRAMGGLESEMKPRDAADDGGQSDESGDRAGVIRFINSTR